MFRHYELIHGNLNPDNIILKSFNENNLNLKLFDFSSSFFFEEKGNIPSPTPEYLPPECLKILTGEFAKINGKELSELE